MRFFFFFSLSVLTALGYCPPSEQDQWQDQFFKCVRTMDAADTEGNDRLNYSEYKKFVRYFAMTLYTIPLFTSGVVPESFKDLFQALIEMSGAENENGYMEIDIYGSNIEDMSLVGAERLTALRKICKQTIQTLESTFFNASPEGAIPTTAKMLVLDTILKQNQQADENDDVAISIVSPDVLSIHSSFVIANFEGLEATDIDVTPESDIFEAYRLFLDELMQTVCPSNGFTYKECWEDPSASYDSAYDRETGRLCGSHAEYVRRIFCDKRERRHRRQQRRQQNTVDLEHEIVQVDNDDHDEGSSGMPDHAIENVVLYKVQDRGCPIPMKSQGKGGGHHPLCQTVYGHYLLHLHDLNVVDKDLLEGVYANITQRAIDNGMLEDSFEKISPDSVFVVEAAGDYILPPVHSHQPFHQRRLSCRRQLFHHSSALHLNVGTIMAWKYQKMWESNIELRSDHSSKAAWRLNGRWIHFFVVILIASSSLIG